MQYFIGLATTLHDPAIAIVDPQGEVVFAEASERYLQNKRAINCEPDHFFRISELIKMYCKPDAEFVIARTWSSRYSRIPFWIAIANAFGLIKPDIITRYKLDRISRLLLLKEYQVYHLLLCFLSAQMKAGANLAAAIRNEFGKRKVSFINYNHHLTHAATACYTSPFSDGACMIVDGFGEEGTIAYCTYNDGTIRLIKRLKGKESLGALYMLITELCGFSSFKAEEWKVMGLASYGKFDKTIYDHLKSIIKVEGCELRYASQTHIRNTINKLEAYKRPSDFSPLVAADLAYTGQLVFSQIMDELLNNFHALTHAENLILGGGCALNSSYAGTILDNTKFKALHIPSAPADDGNALGAALLAYSKYNAPIRPRANVHSPYLGSTMSRRSLERYVKFGSVNKISYLPDAVHKEGARLLAEGKMLGWVQGRAEFGPRALGNRSILADPRDASMKDRINQTVKFREEFRPFAPSILHEYGSQYFENYQESPYMERTLRFRREVIHKVPAVVHIDGTGRLQTVKREWNEKFYELLIEFYALTKIPIILNTSFNVRGKPIIHSVEDVLGLFYTTGLDALIIEDYLIEK